MSRLLVSQCSVTLVSQGMCFIGKRNFADFVGQYLEMQPGPVRSLLDGAELGRHAVSRAVRWASVANGLHSLWGGVPVRDARGLREGHFVTLRAVCDPDTTIMITVLCRRCSLSVDRAFPASRWARARSSAACATAGSSPARCPFHQSSSTFAMFCAVCPCLGLCLFGLSLV